MEQETLYGNDDFYNSNDVDAFDKPLAPAFSTQEDLQINEFNTSSRRLDNYHLTFSSKL